MATLRHRCAALMGVAMLLSTVVGVGAASAQTTPTTYTPGGQGTPCTAGGTAAGNVPIGATVALTLCGPFMPASSVAITVDNQAAGTKAANSSGAVGVAVTVNSANSGTVNDPVNVRLACGSNTVTASGTAFNGTGTATATGTFIVVCGTTTQTGLAFTGANVLKGLLGALLLIVIGGAIVLAQRRRRSSDAL